MGKDVITLLKDNFTNNKTGQEVEGITLVVDGKIKESFDIILNNSNKYKNYTDLLADVIYLGVNEVFKSLD